MKEIGRLAGVSQSTVSRILNGTSGPVRIAPGTRERVLAVVSQLGYTPNPLARGLRGARTAMIGLIVREVSDPFFSTVIGAVGAEARRHGHNVVLGYARSQAEDAAELTWVLETPHCDGLLLLGDLHDQGRLLPELGHSPRPVLALCVGSRAGDVPALNTDNAAGAQLVMDHVWDLGHRRIAFLGTGWLGDVAERRDRYVQFLQERGQVIPDAYLATAENGPRGGYRAAQALLALDPAPTAVFAATDALAAGALKSLADTGRRVPHDVSVAGFDDIPMAEFTTPALTTVRQPVAEMAALAVHDLLAMVGTGRPVPTMRRLAPTLVVRESTAPPP